MHIVESHHNAFGDFMAPGSGMQCALGMNFSSGHYSCGSGLGMTVACMALLGIWQFWGWEGGGGQMPEHLAV